MFSSFLSANVLDIVYFIVIMALFVGAIVCLAIHAEERRQVWHPHSGVAWALGSCLA